MSQAFVKARGDGLGFDFGRAAFCIGLDHPAQANVAVDGKPQPLYVLPVIILLINIARYIAAAAQMLEGLRIASSICPTRLIDMCNLQPCLHSDDAL